MKKIVLFILIVLMITLVSCHKELPVAEEGIFINEICASNKKVLATPNYDYPDWVELYNGNENELSLAGWSISSVKKSSTYYFEKTETIKAYSYYIVYFASDDDAVKSVPFELGAKGDTLTLSNAEGEEIDKVTYTKLDSDTSYCRYKGDYQILVPTPMESNEKAIVYQKIENPVFSNETGFYSSDFTLKLTCSSNAKIYYTTDSSYPTKKSKLYTSNGIEITDKSDENNVLKNRDDICLTANAYQSKTNKCMVIRAIAISDDGNQSEVITKSYFLGDNTYYKGKEVVSLVTDPVNLIDPNTGIYVRGAAYETYLNKGSKGDAPTLNWDQKGRDWERDCNMSYIASDGSFVFDQDCGIRVHGYGGRRNAIKSFNLYSRGCYGKKRFDSSLFGNDNTDSLLLKYDRYSEGNAKFKEGFLEDLMAEEGNITTRDYHYVVLYLNGEYWQHYLLFERYDENFFDVNYGIDEEDLIVIKDNELDYGTDADYDAFIKLQNFVKKNVMSDKNYEYVKSQIDIDSLIDFYVYVAYLNNTDYSYRKNAFVWKSRVTKEGNAYYDSKWRFCAYDFDFACINNTFTSSTTNHTATYNYDTDPFTVEYLFAGSYSSDPWMKNLMTNKEFREKFKARFIEIGTTYLAPEVILPKLKNEYGIKSGVLYEFFEKRADHIYEYLDAYCASFE